MQMSNYRTASRWHIAVLCAVIACLLALFAVVGCSSGSHSAASNNASGSAASSAERSFTDSAGRTVQLPATISRVAVSGPVAQQVMLTFAPDMLIGLAVSIGSDDAKYLGSDYASLPTYGQIYGGKGDFNKEAVSAGNPQVIIDIGEAKDTIKEDMDALQEQLNIPCVHIEAPINGYDTAYTMLGELLGREERGKELADYCAKAYKQISDITSKIPENEKTTILYIVGDSGTNVIAKTSFQAQVVDMVANNVAVVDKASGSGTGNEVSFEQISVWNPSMIVFGPDSVYDKAATEPTWSTLAAISTGNYYEVPSIPYNWLSSPPSVNQILGMQWLARLCYPDKFSDSIQNVATEYYKLFYNYTLADEDFKAIAGNAVQKSA